MTLGLSSFSQRSVYNHILSYPYCVSPLPDKQRHGDRTRIVRNAATADDGRAGSRAAAARTIVIQHLVKEARRALSYLLT